MVKRLISLSGGLVDIRVTGASLTRFLNACAASEIMLHRLKRQDWNTLTASVSISDFKRLRHAMGRTGCTVHITGKRGVPFAARRLRTRYVLWGGGITFLALWFLIVTRVWGITYHMDSTLPRGEMAESLAAYGVKIGVPRADIDASAIRWKMLIDYPELEFFAINVLGNTVEIEATRKVDVPELLDGEAQVKLVATRDGVIDTQQIREGLGMFQTGDAVSIGDTLASSIVPPTLETGSYHVVHARGDVYAYTTTDFTVKQAAELQKKTYTGKVKHQYVLNFGGKRLNLYFGSGIAGGNCDKIVETKQLWLSPSVLFPVTLTKQTYTYYEVSPATITQEQAQERMTASAIDRMERRMDRGEILSHEVAFSEMQGAYELQIQIKAHEQIAEEALDDAAIPAPEQPDEEQQDSG